MVKLAEPFDDEPQQESNESARIRELESLVQLLIRAHEVRTMFDVHLLEIATSLDAGAGCPTCARRGIALLSTKDENLLPPFCPAMRSWGETIKMAQEASRNYDERSSW